MSELKDFVKALKPTVDYSKQLQKESSELLKVVDKLSDPALDRQWKKLSIKMFYLQGIALQLQMQQLEELFKTMED